MLKLREELLSVEEARLSGTRYFTVDETVKMMEATTTEKRDARTILGIVFLLWWRGTKSLVYQNRAFRKCFRTPVVDGRIA